MPTELRTPQAAAGRGFAARQRRGYASIPSRHGSNEMSTPDGIKHQILAYVTPTLTAVCCALLGVVWAMLSSDIKDVKDSQKELSKDIASIRQSVSDIRLEATKATAAIDRQTAQTATRLDALIEETRKRR